MFNKKLKMELVQLREENERLLAENKELSKRLDKRERDIECYKLNLRHKRLEVNSWYYCVYEALMERMNYDNKAVRDIAWSLADRVRDRVEDFNNGKLYTTEDGSI